MIRNETCMFNNPDTADHLWVETLQFPVVIPGEHISALIYINVRPTLGVMWLQVMVIGALADSRAELLHYYENPWLPAPADFRDFTTGGLRIQCFDEPRTWRIDYVAEDGTEIHVDWTGLMEPFDIHDPAHSPQAGSMVDIHADLAAGSDRGHAGHFDMSGQITGSLTVRDREFTVDAIERMDRSWGPRDPMKVRNMFIVSATFGEDLFFHMICPWDPEKPYGEQFHLTHGYVVENGEVYGLTTDLKMTTRHLGLVCTTMDMTVTDVRGKSHRLSASADIGAPWMAAPSSQTHNSLMSFIHEGRDGYGIVFSAHTMPWMNARRGRFHTDPSPAIYC